MIGLPSLQAVDRAQETWIWLASEATDMRCGLDRLAERVRQSQVVATDDTILPMLSPDKTKQARMWVYIGDPEHPYNVFDFTLEGSREGPKHFLKDYSQVLLADAYGGYDGIVVGNALIRAGCWPTRGGSLSTQKKPRRKSRVR